MKQAEFSGFFIFFRDGLKKSLWLLLQGMKRTTESVGEAKVLATFRQFRIDFSSGMFIVGA